MQTTFDNLLRGAKFFTPSMGANLLEKHDDATAIGYHSGERIPIANPALRVDCITPFMVKRNGPLLPQR